MPTFGSLFAGIGGIDLGLERAGWECRWQVEWDAYCQRVLAKHWPDIPRCGDITAVDWSGVERVDLLAGGFPCQPFSVAGRRRGVEDERWLWPEFARAIRALRPSYVLVENVPGLLAGHGGMGRVLGDLAELGYDAEWDSIPAAAVGAPHLRYRVWIVAHAVGQRQQASGAGRAGDDAALRGGRGDPRYLQAAPIPSGGSDVADANRIGRQSIGIGGLFDSFRAAFGDDLAGCRGQVPDPHRRGAQGLLEASDDPAERSGPDERPLGLLRRAGRDRQWATEPDVGRVAHGVPARVDRLRALGNAVVPQVVEVIGTRLLALLEAERSAA